MRRPDSSAAGPTVTIAICTANRAALLAETLAAVLPLVDPASVELLVVDNGSTDPTPRLLAELAELGSRGPDALPGGLRAVREERTGLSAARNRAVREARGDLLLFLDDDALPAPGWIEAYLAAFRDPRVGAAGGPVEPIFDGELPAWLDARFLPYLSVWDRGSAIERLRYNELPRGANMAFRRSSFAVYGDFLEQLGRKGASLRSCEEIEYCLRLERGGDEILYVPSARVRHHVSTQRLTVDWMGARFAAQGFSEAILDWRHAGARGLQSGWRRVARLDRSPANAHAHDPLTDAFAVCQRRAAHGYRRGALYALFCVARFQPPQPIDLAPFQPPA